MGGTVQTIPDGVMLPLDSLPQVFTYDGDNVVSITVEYSGRTYVQTFTYDGDNVIYISGWMYTPVPPGGQPMITQDGQVMYTEDDEIMYTEN